MTTITASPEEPLFQRIREELYSAVLGDVMDAIGLTRQFLPPEIRVQVPGAVIAGRAMTVQEADLPSTSPPMAGPSPLA